ncbi:hypothetical protein BST97_00125 [Nonlabens spongiae]|uniref:Glycosyltransferase 2-like domain-containing protein n=1 Tax=Nonlabens spongiae TaxID=331648 RepID=A0A1W6MG05_9FLAO|nr:glycosyltransferase family 2 protein [Nonlabens spongiae]ARN76534.1 hypothetical protein BST97_00125 [Nonlabens spongiae]
MDLISVIIPLYNAEDFVEKAYDFIKNQKELKVPVEIIFVDNNSKDSSFEKAKHLAQKDEQVKVFRETRQGAPSARNKGFKESKGNFLYFFDADDQLFDDALASLYNVLTSQDVHAVCGRFIKSHKNIEDLSIKEMKYDGDVKVFQPPFLGLLWFKDLSTTIGPPGFMYTRRVFEELGMYNVEIPASEDTAFDIDLGMRYPVATINKLIYLYFKHENATTTILKKKKSRAFMQWPRIIHSHVPFHKKHPDNHAYTQILKEKIFSSIPRMIHETNGYQKRKELFNKTKTDIYPLELPRTYDLALKLLVLTNNPILFKFILFKMKSRYIESYDDPTLRLSEYF